MAITIYGSARSRTMRVLWAATEAGVDFRHVPLEPGSPGTREAGFRRLNPSGRVPVLVDGELVLSESLAITLYLARRDASNGLLPQGLEGEAQAWRWTLWAQGHLEPWLQRDARHAALLAAAAEHVAPVVAAELALLDGHLAAREWLVGDGFTVADLNVASVLSPSRTRRLALGQWRDLRAWLVRCRTRPAWVATRRRFAPAERPDERSPDDGSAPQPDSP